MTDQYPSPQPAVEAEELGLKNLSEEQLFQNILSVGSEWTLAERDLVVTSYELVSVLHKDDRHRDQPYIYHLLRNANRATGYLHITDPEIITAIILHDSVEDHPDEIIQISRFGNNGFLDEMPTLQDDLAKQEQALTYIESAFSPRVAQIVGGMTNPPHPKDKEYSYEARLQQYWDHVAEAIEDASVWVGKIVDWGDNGLGIVHSDFSVEPSREPHFMRKYGSLVHILEARYYRPDIQAMLDPLAKANIERMFLLARERLLVHD
jgi:hypothetical protein